MDTQYVSIHWNISWINANDMDYNKFFSLVLKLYSYNSFISTDAYWLFILYYLCASNNYWQHFRTIKNH